MRSYSLKSEVSRLPAKADSILCETEMSPIVLVGVGRAFPDGDADGAAPLSTLSFPMLSLNIDEAASAPVPPSIS